MSEKINGVKFIKNDQYGAGPVNYFPRRLIAA
jgi:hypothetical protein